jgi:hypothetical protein
MLLTYFSVLEWYEWKNNTTTFESFADKWTQLRNFGKFFGMGSVKQVTVYVPQPS